MNILKVISIWTGRGFALACCCLFAWAMPVASAEPSPDKSDLSKSDLSKADVSKTDVAKTTKPRLDRSGEKRVGKASVYAKKFGGRTMADGTPMDLQGDNAASKTLPLGTTAKVTNLENGKSTTVTIRDRGPYVKGRIVDLSPATAREIGVKGLARVEVAPVEVPLRGGGTKAGEGAEEVQEALRDKADDEGADEDS
jgi:rare lipoprotein A